ncbi:hypothetical protein [Marinifilum caeruleilacunae]|uniref:Uncharacterized protein n=1 Tax=Marinifilum caeruleilacunae TaxID=2499076 RepID=A0ABX1WXS2_9BACT|nr:hypothetical protein [Marinifilum caeruleilacunae]NOU60879.1 hypothetical protein [Marinifilum caeruleilacunae]
MASKKEFKKDVNFLTNEIVMRGMIHLEFFGEKNSEQIFEIMNKAVESRNDYISRINDRLSGKNAKEVKAHFKLIYDDLLKSTHNLLEEIDGLDITVK